MPAERLGAVPEAGQARAARRAYLAAQPARRRHGPGDHPAPGRARRTTVTADGRPSPAGRLSCAGRSGHSVIKGLAGDEVPEDPALMAAKTAQTSSPVTLAALMKSIGTVVIAVFVFGIVIWWLAVVFNRLGTAPQVNAKGAVVVDQFQRATDILFVVFPLAAAAVGYWLGNQGRARAQEEARQAQSKITALLGSSADGDLLKKAAATFPAAFPELSHPGLAGPAVRATK
jgi:hypothetical protein